MALAISQPMPRHTPNTSVPAASTTPIFFTLPPSLGP